MSAREGGPLYILSFDHRGSSRSGLLGIAGSPDQDELTRIREFKALSYTGLEQAIAAGASERAPGLAVDEEFGSGIARSARVADYTPVLPVEQSGQVGGDQDSYDRQLRPALVVRTIAALQDAGVEHRIWKVEGRDERADCELVVAQARRDGRDTVDCIVLGGGVNLARATPWLRQAAPVPGYIGCAVGRTIREDTLRDHLGGRLDARAASAWIAHEDRRAIDVCAAAAAATPAA